MSPSDPARKYDTADLVFSALDSALAAVALSDEHEAEIARTLASRPSMTISSEDMASRLQSLREP